MGGSASPLALPRCCLRRREHPAHRETAASPTRRTRATRPEREPVTTIIRELRGYLLSVAKEDDDECVVVSNRTRVAAHLLAQWQLIEQLHILTDKKNGATHPVPTALGAIRRPSLVDFPPPPCDDSPAARDGRATMLDNAGNASDPITVVAGIVIPSETTRYFCRSSACTCSSRWHASFGRIGRDAEQQTSGLHPRFGLIYYWCLAAVFVSATVLSATRWVHDYHLFSWGRFHSRPLHTAALLADDAGAAGRSNISLAWVCRTPCYWSRSMSTTGGICRFGETYHQWRTGWSRPSWERCSSYT